MATEDPRRKQWDVDWAAVDESLRQGVSQRKVAKQLGMPLVTFYRRLREHRNGQPKNSDPYTDEPTAPPETPKEEPAKEPPLYMAAAALRILFEGKTPNGNLCTIAALGEYYDLVRAMGQEAAGLNGADPATVGMMMRDLWHAAREDPRYAALKAHLDLLDANDTAEQVGDSSFNSYQSAANDVPPRAGHISSNSYNSSHRPATIPWPTLDKQAVLYGPAGVFTLAVDEYTEADPVAVLINTLAAFGNVVGPGPHFRVEHTEHPLRMFGGLVGDSSKGRKGLSWSTPRHVFRRIDEAWALGCVTSGLSSGEGLIYHVRDPRVEKQPVKQKGRVVDYEEVIVDAGVEDKRLFVVEEEFAQALKVMRREGNILSPVLREAWDTGNLHPLTKSNPIKATGAHISIVGHITTDELLRHLDSTEQANGFANRFLWALVRRSKEIAEPEGVPDRTLNPIILMLGESVHAAKGIRLMRRDEEARGYWGEIYSDLSSAKPGLFGHITARAEAQVMRLACLYAALDKTCVVSRRHLEAGLAVWRYCEASARYIFGDATGDPIVDEITRLLRRSEKGLTRTEVSSHFGRNKPADELARAFTRLLELKLAFCREEETGGRKAERWFASYG